MVNKAGFKRYLLEKSVTVTKSGHLSVDDFALNVMNGENLKQRIVNRKYAKVMINDRCFIKLADGLDILMRSRNAKYKALSARFSIDECDSNKEVVTKTKSNREAVVEDSESSEKVTTTTKCNRKVAVIEDSEKVSSNDANNGAIVTLNDTNYQSSDTDIKQHVINGMIDTRNNALVFGKLRFPVIFEMNGKKTRDIWMRASETAHTLEYGDAPQAIRYNVNPINILEYRNLVEREGVVRITMAKIDPNTKFINLSGFMNLIHASTKDVAKKIRYWMDNEVIPSLFKNGSYSIQPTKLELGDFHKTNTFANYGDAKILYIAYVGVHDREYIFKYGKSNDVFNRVNQHRYGFDTFDLCYVEKCDNNDRVETLFKRQLEAQHVYRKLEIKGRQVTELFTISIVYPPSYFYEMMTTLIENNPLPATKDANSQISQLQVAVNQRDITIDALRISEDNTKQKYIYKQSANYAKALEVKKMKLENLDKLQDLMKLKIDMEKEKTKQVAIANNVDLEMICPETRSQKRVTNVITCPMTSSSPSAMSSIRHTTISIVPAPRRTTGKLIYRKGAFVL